MKKKIIFIMIALLLIPIATATLLDDIYDGYSEKLGMDNVTMINDYQLVYFYDITIQYDNWTVISNETGNYSINNPYEIKYYRANIVEIDGYNIINRIVSEVEYP